MRKCRERVSSKNCFHNFQTATEGFVHIPPYNANFEWQILTKAEVSLGLEWYGPRHPPIFGFFLFSRGRSRTPLTPLAKLLQFLVWRSAFPSFLASPSRCLSTPPPFFVLAVPRNPCPGPFLAMLASRPSREIYSNSNSSTTSRP